MNILKQQQINDIQNLLKLENLQATKTVIEAVYDSLFDMIMIHQKDGDRVITPIGIFESYVRKATTYTNPQHPEGERINSPARVMPKLNYARKYDASFRNIPVDQVTLERE